MNYKHDKHLHRIDISDGFTIDKKKKQIMPIQTKNYEQHRNTHTMRTLAKKKPFRYTNSKRSKWSQQKQISPHQLPVVCINVLFERERN